MSPQEAKVVIELLAKGIDPTSGEIINESALNNPQIIRALFIAVAALESAASIDKSNRSQPSNAGRAWTHDDDVTLLDMYDSGKSIKDISAEFERTRGAIRSRLKHLGKLNDLMINKGNANIDKLESLRNDDSQNSVVNQNGFVSQDLDDSKSKVSNSTTCDEFQFFDKLMLLHPRISSFLMQIGPIPNAPELWIVGDGKSRGQMIEHIDAVNNRRDAIDRLVQIFCEWVNECSKYNKDPLWHALKRQFELLMKAQPDAIFELLQILNKESDEKIYALLRDFIARKGY